MVKTLPRTISILTWNEINDAKSRLQNGHKNTLMTIGKKNNKTIVDERDVEIVNQQGFDRQISVYEHEIEYSVYNLLPSNASFLKDRMNEVPEEYREMDHFDLRKELKPTPTLNQLRLNFWAEYDRCVELGKKKRSMLLPNVIAGVCSMRVFKTYLQDIEKIAWILTPVQSYNMGVQDILETCLYKMREGLEKIDMSSVKDMNTVMKIYEAFDKRVHGDYEQKITKKVKYEGTSGILEPKQVKDKMRELGIINDKVVVYDKGED